ncbi:MAG: hypothetical protein K2R98_24870 [Gemmataceae bacterium]|nr:hypothetical protein [Gemmataceae bacterium]
MPIFITCHKCGNQLKAGDHLAGRTLRCNKCLSDFTVPNAPAPVAQFAPSFAPPMAAPPPPAELPAMPMEEAPEFELTEDVVEMPMMEEENLEVMEEVENLEVMEEVGFEEDTSQFPPNQDDLPPTEDFNWKPH